MDSDCLVKLTKAGAKEALVAAMEVHIPPLVKKETVDYAKACGYHDAFAIEENIKRESLHVVGPRSRRSPAPALPGGRGEADVVALYLDGSYDAIASDDQRFLKWLEAADIPYLTPAACLMYAYRDNKVGRPKALEMLESLRPFISRAEYAVTKLYLEDKS